jgi:hypothetical protein
MNSLVVFSNFRVNDEERFIRLKDSFQSFKNICASKWIINVRGLYSNQVKKYLEENLQNSVKIYQIESGKGWFSDTRTILNELDSDYLLYWTEDQISVVSPDIYEQILKELSLTDSEYLFISWFIHDQFTGVYETVNKTRLDNISVFTLTKETAKVLKRSHPRHYIISAQGIFKTNFFKKIVNSNHPYLRRWPKETPFDLEKKIIDFEFLPLKTAIPNFELFAPIDDDMDGYPCSLQTRGLYPKREVRVSVMKDYSNNSYVKIIKKCTNKKVRNLVYRFVVIPYYNFIKICKRISYHF